MKIRTKAEMLMFLTNKVKTCYVLPLLSINYVDWLQNSSSFVDKVLSIKSDKLVVRSSAQGEDKKGDSNAGRYLSILGVINTATQVVKAIDDVFSSYEISNGEHQVLIQPELQDIAISGVVFTHEPNTSSPYFVINYDDTSGRTDTVTSGVSNQIKVSLTSHFCPEVKSWQSLLINSINEIQQLVDEDSLDIEFAIDAQGDVYIFQVRSLLLNKEVSFDLASYQLELNCIHNKIYRLSQRHPYLLGKKSAFGLMPDWNPAEIIGTKPRPLALSLYKELITDSVWSHQRSKYGYRNVKDFPLLVVLGGTPYVDVRLSFNSFIPQSLNEHVAEKLVNHYMAQLEESPELHDKVEFAIVHSCFSFDIDNRLAPLVEHGFDLKEINQIQDSLVELTKTLIEDEKSVWRKDIQRISTLQDKQKELQLSHLNSVEKIYWILKDCRNFGTLPFAGLARVGFIAMQILESMVTIKAITLERYHEFLNGINTVSSELMSDFHCLSQKDFLALYGHLRPGTYDILSKRYDEDADFYFDWQKQQYKEKSLNIFTLSAAEQKLIDEKLVGYGFSITAESLFGFIKEAIEAREQGKFVFSRSLSDCFKWIEKLGHKLDFSREDMSFVDIKDILKLYSNSLSAKAAISSSLALGTTQYGLTQKVHLPALIFDEKQTYQFNLMHEQPNFITQNNVAGPVVALNKNSLEELTGCIVFIEAADPGYDWIFSKGILGFVTKYGGCNSHMAIRANELNIPAIVGAGEHLFNQWVSADKLLIDCENKKVSSF